MDPAAVSPDSAQAQSASRNSRMRNRFDAAATYDRAIARRSQPHERACRTSTEPDRGRSSLSQIGRHRQDLLACLADFASACAWRCQTAEAATAVAEILKLRPGLTVQQPAQEGFAYSDNPTSRGSSLGQSRLASPLGLAGQPRSSRRARDWRSSSVAKGRGRFRRSRKRPPKRDFVPDRPPGDVFAHGTVEKLHSRPETPKGPTAVGPFDFSVLLERPLGYEFRTCRDAPQRSPTRTVA